MFLSEQDTQEQTLEQICSGLDHFQQDQQVHLSTYMQHRNKTCI
jgi:hypothetical protein